MNITLRGVADQSYCSAELRISTLPSAQHSFDLELSSAWPALTSLSSVMKTRGILMSGLLGHVELYPHSLIVEHTLSSVKRQQMTPK